MYLCVRDIDFVDVSTICRLNFGTVATVCVLSFRFIIYLFMTMVKCNDHHM